MRYCALPARVSLLSGNCLLFLFILPAIFAQNIDSLQHELRKAGNTEDSIRILCRLTWNVSSTDSYKTLIYGKKALSLVKGNEDKKVISEAFDAAALGYWVNHQTDIAKKLYKKSLSIGEKYHYPDRIAWANYNLGQIAMNEMQTDSGLIYFRKSAQAFEKAAMSDMMINSCWKQIKIVRSDARDQICNDLICKIEKVIQTTEDKNQLAFRYLDLSKVYGLLENRTKSLEYVLKALEISEETDNQKGIFTAYSSIGDYLRDVQHNHRVALQYYERILENYRKYNISWGIAETLDEIGLAYMNMNNDSLAVKYFNESLEAAKKVDSKYYVSTSYMHLGEISFRKGDYGKALSLFLQNLNNNCQSCDPLAAHDILILIGNTYSKLEENKQAFSYYSKSLMLADSMQEPRYVALSLMNMGEWYLSAGNTNEAINHFIKAYANALRTKDLSLQVKSAGKLSESFYTQKNYKKAYEYRQISGKLEDSIRQMNESEDVARVETLFEFENLRMQREIENAKSTAEIEKQVITRNVFLAGFIAMSMLGIFLFITIRRKKKDNLQLQEQKKKIEVMSEKIHKSDKMKLQFFTNISHEFRTPLTLISGLSEELAKSSQESSKWKNQLQIIQKNTSKLLHLVNQILDIRKLDNGDSALVTSRDDLVKFIGGLVTLFEDYAKRKNIGLKFVSEKNCMVIDSDFNKIEKIISNLLSNAVKFCSDNDHIRVTLYTEENPRTAFVLEVDDTGKGIPSDQLQYVFQPFYQVAGTEGGSGIGLALVRELVNLLDGKVDIESQLNKGTRVTVKIPYEPNEVGTNIIKPTLSKSIETSIIPTSESGRTAELNSFADTGNEKSLLIVEDNTDLLNYIGDILSDEFNVLKATNGKLGLALALKFVPDIIISDIMMPEMDGNELCEALKNNPYTSHIPVLMLTAKTDQDSMLQSFRLGADDYIIKPFSAVLLKSRIDNLINQRKKLIEKFSRQFQFEPSEVLLPDNDKTFLEKVIQVIEEHIDDPELDIDILAGEMCVSRTQLYRKLKALTGLSGNQFIRIIRLKRAAQLLGQNQLNIAEVMQMTGFSNYSHFNQCFKEQFGYYPKEYAQSGLR